MHTPTTENMFVLEPRQKPKCAALITELNRATLGSGEYIAAMQRAHEIRYCLWSGQTGDGKKGKDANGRLRGPWLNSSDVKVRMAEEIIQEHWLVLMLGWLRSGISAVPTEMEDEGKAQLATSLMKHYLTGPMMMEGLAAVARAGDDREFFGCGFIRVNWKTSYRLVKKTTSLAALQQWARDQGTQQAMQFLAEAIPEDTEIAPEEEAQLAAGVEQAGVDAAAAVVEAASIKDGREELAGWLEQMDPSMCPGESLRLAAAMQRAAGAEMEYCATELKESRPQWRARQLGVDLFLPPETGELCDAPYVVESAWMTEVQVREAADEEGWDPHWTEKVLTKPGRAFSIGISGGSDWFLQNAGVCLSIPAMERERGLFQIVRMFYKATTKYGTVGVWETLLHDADQERSGLHRLVDWADGEYPFVAFPRELHQRLIWASRGIALMVESEQSQLKGMADARHDLTAMTVRPPVKKHYRLANTNMQSEIRPGGELVERDGAATDFMRIGHAGAAGQSLTDEEVLMNRLRRAFGLMDESVPESLTQAYMEVDSGVWLMHLTQLMQLTWMMVQKFMPVDMAMRVGGGPELFAAAGGAELMRVSSTEMQGRYDFKLMWNPTDMNIEWVKARAEILATLLIPLDTAGAVDRTPIIRMLLNWISPQMAANVKSAPQAAADETDAEQAALSIITSGGEPRFQAGQNHALRLEVIQALMQKSPVFARTVQSSPEIQTVLEQRMKMHQQQLDQEANKQIGRDGAAYALLNPQ